MLIKIHEKADIDLFDGYTFYESQSFGLGEYFLDSLYSDIESLIIYAGIHPKINGYHRHLSRIFPYVIYYKIIKEQIIIFAVLVYNFFLLIIIKSQ